jgi:hypothetical protein
MNLNQIKADCNTVTDLFGKATKSLVINDFMTIIKSIPANGIGVELGSGEGGFSSKFLKNTPNSVKLVCIDDWLSNRTEYNAPSKDKDAPVIEPVKREEDYRKFSEAVTVGVEEGRVIILEGDFLTEVNRIPHNSVDFIYVDGDMGDTSVNASWLARYWMKLKIGGILSGNGFDRAVHPVCNSLVRQFAGARGLKINLVKDAPSTWWIVK